MATWSNGVDETLKSALGFGEQGTRILQKGDQCQVDLDEVLFNKTLDKNGAQYQQPVSQTLTMSMWEKEL